MTRGPTVLNKIESHRTRYPGQPFFSFEFFPPKTESGMQNLINRLDRMKRLSPLWIDVTWGAGGSTADKTFDICKAAFDECGLDVMMHLTCTNMNRATIDEALMKCWKVGIRNILALRGDPPLGEEWKQIEGGFAHASDLVRHIRKEYGDYFCIGVAGYPEGHIDCVSRDADLKFLKQKVDSGADLVVTQLFYEPDMFMKFVQHARSIGIHCPIVPGIMPIQSHASFTKMTDFCKTHVPPCLREDLQKVEKDDAKMKEFGVKQGIDMCRQLLDSGCEGLHFYTLNQEGATTSILEGLGLASNKHSSE